MSHLNRGGRTTAVIAAVALAGGAATAQAGAATTPKTAQAALGSLVTQTRLVPSAALTRSQRRNLLRFATHARRVARTKPCTAVTDLARYRRVLRFVKVKPLATRKQANRRLAALGPASLVASSRLLAGKRTKACGGGVAPSTRAAAQTTVMSSDSNGMRLQVKLPALRFVPQTGGGRTWTQLVVPTSKGAAAPGSPGIPVVASTFAVPDGAKLTVIPGSATSYTVDGVDVYPTQKDPVDADTPKPDFLKGPFATPAFSLDPTAYKTPGLVPEAPADGAVIGQARDITIGGLQVPAAQYDAVKRKLKVLDTVDVKVTFDGGSKAFNPDLGSPWERGQRSLAKTFLNANLFGSLAVGPFRRCGEEMMIITNPATQAAADQLAVGKRAQGWRTSVFPTGSVTGTTAVQIQAFIRAHLTAANCIHPSYVTIMGDDDLVPTHPGISGIPSDLPYALKTDSDELPDVAVGRIIGNDQTEVATAVTKILGYETTAPTANGMLGKAVVAAQFQDDDADGRENRNFVFFAETLRNGLAARGVAVDRVYGESPGNNPQQFNDGTSLPAALLKPTFPWTGTGAQVSTAWNEGRFMVVHRDHGWSDGWGTPGYGTADVNALTNGAKLPVVLSINCSSGAYDYDETSFAGQALVKADGGAVGVFGDTRDSPTFANTNIALGFADALLPSILPGEGPTTKQRTGDALIAGKLRLAGIAPPPNGDTRNELYLWHYFGDPSMQMWGGGSAPLVFDPRLFAAVYKAKLPTPGDPPPFEVNVTLPQGLAGQPISLLQNGQVIGKAFAGDGVATIPAAFGDGSVRPGELEVAFEGDGAQPVKVPVTGVPEPEAPKPDLVVSELTGGTVTIKNQGAGAAGAFKTTITDSQANVLTLTFAGLAAGASATQSYDCAKLLRSRTAAADAGAQVAETDESNNGASGVFSCAVTG